MQGKMIRIGLAAVLVAACAFLGRAIGGEESEPAPTVKAVRVVMPGIDIDRYGERYLTVTLYFPHSGACLNLRIEGPTGTVGPADATRNAKPWWMRITDLETGLRLELPTRDYSVPKKLMNDAIALADLQRKLNAEAVRISKEVQAAGLLRGAAEQAGEKPVR